MKQVQRNLFVVAGVISAVVGTLASIPSFAAGNYTFAAVATVFVIAGIILIAIGFGD